MLYNFEKLEDYLISIDVKIIDDHSAYKIIKALRRRDVTALVW